MERVESVSVEEPGPYPILVWVSNAVASGIRCKRDGRGSGSW
jgi:hypothetical protein